MAYHRQQGVDTAIVRIFNTYGPRMRPHDGRAIPTFLRQALPTGRSRSSATAARRARSATSTTWSAASSRWPSPASTTRSTSATRTSSRCSSSPRPSSRSPGRVGDRPRGAADGRPAGQRRPDIGRARDLLGLGAQVDLRDGLQRTIDQAGAERFCAGGDDAPAGAPSVAAHVEMATPRPWAARATSRRARARERDRSAARARRDRRASARALEHDVRRKRPPALSFLLRWETAAPPWRASSRCWRSTSPASSSRSTRRSG